MEDLIRTQQSEANTIEQMVVGIMEEEESLDGRLSQQQQTHKQDVAFLQQHSTRKFFVTQDLRTLKHILTSMHTGYATPQQSIMYTAKIKAGIANNFQYVNITIMHDTLTSTYKAALYTPAQLHSVQPLLQAWPVRTDRNTYLTHGTGMVQYTRKVLTGPTKKQ
jgi:tRNA C32,U32 (ribose-2'-O)-methylase TrmJ